MPRKGFSKNPEFTANLSAQSEHRHEGSILIPKASKIINENTPCGYTT